MTSRPCTDVAAVFVSYITVFPLTRFINRSIITPALEALARAVTSNCYRRPLEITRSYNFPNYDVRSPAIRESGGGSMEAFKTLDAGSSEFRSLEACQGSKIKERGKDHYVKVMNIGIVNDS